MEISITRISANGQIVIPSEIRKEAKINPSAKFLVYSVKGHIILKRLDESFMEEEKKMIDEILKSEKDISEGKFTKTNSRDDADQIDDLLRR